MLKFAEAKGKGLEVRVYPDLKTIVKEGEKEYEFQSPMEALIEMRSPRVAGFLVSILQLFLKKEVEK